MPARARSNEPTSRSIAFLSELFVEFFELVDPALQARDVAFEGVHGVLIFSVLAPQLGIVFKDFHQIVVITLQFLWHAGVPPCSCQKRSANFCAYFSVLHPAAADRIYNIIDYILGINKEIFQ